MDGHNDDSIRLWGFEIGHLPRYAQLIIAASAVSVAYLAYGVLQVLISCFS
jgi:hypothetical protein